MFGRQSSKASRQLLCLNHRCSRRGCIESSTSARAVRMCTKCLSPMWEPARACGVRYFGWIVVSKADSLGNWWAAVLNPWTRRIEDVAKSFDAMKAGAKARRVIDGIRESQENADGRRAS